jgi:hypothetical protein
MLPSTLTFYVNQNYINTLITDIGQVLLDSAKQIFGVKLVNTNYGKKKKINKGDKTWFDNLFYQYQYYFEKY